MFRIQGNNSFLKKIWIRMQFYLPETFFSLACNRHCDCLNFLSRVDLLDKVILIFIQKYDAYFRDRLMENI